MGWLDAHESYLMEVIARDRVDDLRCTADVAPAHAERTTSPTGAIPGSRHAPVAGRVRCPRTLAKAS